ncbi:unnamed protein product [Arctogadus glacialis]
MKERKTPSLGIYSDGGCEPLAGRNEAGVPRGYWNFSWVAEDKLGFPRARVPAPGPISLSVPLASAPCQVPATFGLPSHKWMNE